jgi:hypothetical protein
MNQSSGFKLNGRQLSILAGCWKRVFAHVILSAAKDRSIYLQTNAGMLRFAQHDNFGFFGILLGCGQGRDVFPACRSDRVTLHALCRLDVLQGC